MYKVRNAVVHSYSFLLQNFLLKGATLSLPGSTALIMDGNVSRPQLQVAKMNVLSQVPQGFIHIVNNASMTRERIFLSQVSDLKKKSVYLQGTQRINEEMPCPKLLSLVHSRWLLDIPASEMFLCLIMQQLIQKRIREVSAFDCRI